MSVFQASLLGIVYFLGNSSLFFGGIGFFTIYRPLVAGFFVGLILGDPVMGTIVGATINLMYIGFISAGGALPGDPCLAGVLGTAFAITGGISAEVAIALAVPIGLLGTVVWIGRMTICTFFVHRADKMAEKGDINNIWKMSVLYPHIALFLLTAVPCFLAAYFGANYITSFINFLGDNILGVLGVVGGMMPALGIALNLKAIYKGEARVFFFIGFLMIVYFSLDMIGIGLLSLCVAIVMIQLKNNGSKKEITVNGK